jgi:hypothetical protein
MEYCSSSDEARDREREGKQTVRERKAKGEKDEGRGTRVGTQGRVEGGRAPSLAVVLAVVVCERREDRLVRGIEREGRKDEGQED